MIADFTPAEIRTLLAQLPSGPGVYQMYLSGKVIYVGKAKHLKRRVTSYFQTTTKHTAAKAQMVRLIDHIEVIETTSELEALILETNLIKSIRPKYNILMKDDKNLSYIAIRSGPIEEVYRSRQKLSSGELYGPFISWARVSQTLDALKRVFMVRSCRMQFAERSGRLEITDRAGKSVPCLDYYIGLCPAPCTLESSKVEMHRANVARLRRFLNGAKEEVLTELQAKMMKHAESREYEQAKKIKETIDAINVIQSSNQIVRDVIPGRYDVCVIGERAGMIVVSRLEIRDSQVIGLSHHEIESTLGESHEELLIEAMLQLFVDSDRSDRLLLSHAIDSTSQEILEGIGLKIEIPVIGPKREIVQFALHNNAEYLHRKALEQLENNTLTRSHMQRILETIGYSVPDEGSTIRFECYDISHTDGRYTVASRSVLVDGESATRLYRKYKITDIPVGKIDDFASMREVMRRRMIEGVKEKNFPHLIIIDGGKGQLSSAIEGLDAGIEVLLSEGYAREDIMYPQIVSIAKRIEEVFLPYQRDPVLFEHGQSELRVFQKIRDEAHRFAITFNRSLRTKDMKKNILEDIPLIGPVTRRKLLKLAGSIDMIRELSLEDISRVTSAPQRQSLIDHGIWSDQK